MNSPCEVVVRYFLPACRALIAKQLIEKYRYTQNAVAYKLGITQAAVSMYLSSTRGNKYLAELEANSQAQRTINQIVERVSSNSLNHTVLPIELCTLCQLLRNSNLICTIHRDHVNLPETCNACTTSNIGSSSP